MGVLLRLLVAMPFLLILVLLGWVAGLIVPPIAAEVVGSSAVSAVGFGSGVGVTLKVGLRWGLPLLGLGIVIWVVFGDLRFDLGPR